LKEYKRETIIENDSVKIDMDTDGTAYIESKKGDLKLGDKDIQFLSKVSEIAKEE